MCTGSGEASRAGSGPLWIWQLGGFAADPPTGSGSSSQLIMRTYPDARLRADARGRDGGVREELEAGAKGVDRPAGGSIQNEPRRLKRIKALHWQTPARGSFDPQRLSGALANRLAPRRATAIQRLGHRRAPGR